MYQIDNQSWARSGEVRVWKYLLVFLGTIIIAPWVLPIAIGGMSAYFDFAQRTVRDLAFGYCDPPLVHQDRRCWNYSPGQGALK